MITYDLICENGHEFEGWFENSEEYETQFKKGLISCPYCETISISKVLSPVGYIKSNSIGSSKKEAPKEENPHALEADIKKMSNYVEKNFEDVGTNFAEKVLKMHYGVEEPKNIRGTTTQEEEKNLQKEGINYISVPKINDKEE